MRHSIVFIQADAKRSASMPADCGQYLWTLRPGQLYLWTVSTDSPADRPIADHLQAILSEDEQKDARRFHRAKDRHQFVIARALVRLALSQHFLIPPGDWRFHRDHNGN